MRETKSEKTIICRIQDLTKRKKGLLIKEYTNARGYLKGDIEDLYSATKQAMDKYTEKVKESKEYPLHLRNDTFKVEKAENTEEFDYWAKIPVSNVWGGIWVPIKPREVTPQQAEGLPYGPYFKRKFAFPPNLSHTFGQHGTIASSEELD
ncbi:MAG: hypothetical protein BTN85_1597 [Candidatus Methanohalarchaeum thermophilum]|uniref:Uncharacterized protein n=1 Tax=Methanohalarchaeum thermophilum TaxID=1903181 RepID=A0A1Q6DXM5_METT1|nr:MAG: hypothetical protein BTN85_1597 [Candidatus Methanohalarchaeum thermophilum]